MSTNAKLNIAKYYIRCGQYGDAIKILESIDDNHPDVKYLLGSIYHKGLHSDTREPDIKKAEYYYRDAAEAGLTDAIWMMGMINFHGPYGYKQDLVRAREYFYKGALAGHSDCQYLYAWMCKNGLGGKYDAHEVIQFFKKGAEQGHIGCMPELALMYQQPECRDDSSAFYWARKASDAGDKLGNFLTGTFYLTGTGCDCDIDMARSHLKVATETGMLEAEQMLQRVESIYEKEELSFYKLKEKMPEAKANFYGRQSKLEEIDRRFREGKRILFLEGIGGIGKTELAKAYAKAHRNDYRRILFVTYESDLRSLVCDQGSFYITGCERMEAETEKAWFKRKLAMLHSVTDSQTLIITDNYDTDADPDFNDYVDGNCRMIFTTRNAHPNYTSIKVETIEDENVLLDIFKANCGWKHKQLTDSERVTILDIIHMVGCHTYTIELLAKQLQESRLYPEELKKRLSDEGIASVGSEKVTGKSGLKDSAYGHIRAVFAASRLNNDEKRIMRFLSFLGAEGIPAVRFKEWAGLSSYDVVNALKESSWIREDNEHRLSLHPVVAEIMKKELKPDYANCTEFLERMTDYIFDSWYRPFSENTTVRGSVLAVADYFKSFDNLPIDIWIAITEFLWQTGAFTESINYAKMLYHKCLDSYGNSNVKTGYAARVLGNSYYCSGNVEEAYPWFEKAVRIYEESGERTEDAARAYELLGRELYVTREHRDFELAKQYFDKTIEIREELIKMLSQDETISFIERRKGYEYNLEKARDTLAGSYFQMGRMFLTKGDYGEAYKYIDHSEKLRDVNLVDRDPSRYALLKMYKGICQYQMTKTMLQQALENLKTSLDINLKYRGRLQIDTLDNQEYLGDVYAVMGEGGKAGDSYQKALEMGEMIFGSDSERVRQVKEKMSKIWGDSESKPLGWQQ